MSSTTSSPVGRRDRGQVLVLFAGGVFAILVVAALAFDVGMMLLERRDEQNAADAAALAGARYIFEADCVAPDWVCTKARAAALQVASLNGYDDADPTESVLIEIPPTDGRYIALPNFIEVEIDSERASIFAGVFGQATWPVSVFAVATNDQSLTFPFSTLALNETACKAIHVSGTGIVEAYGNVQANSNGSDCPDGSNVGFSRTGGGTITIFADDATCRSAGEIQSEGSGTMTCAQAENSFALPDPLAGIDPPAKPGLAAPMVQMSGPSKPVLDHCPGAVSPKTPPSETQTTTCDVNGNGGAYRGIKWLLSPGLYPAGLMVDNEATAYLLPGIYWIGGGGFQVSGDASVISVASQAEAAAMAADPTQTRTLFDAGGGGIMIYNSKLPTSAAGSLTLGHAGGVLLLKALDVPATDPPDPNEDYDDISIFQDRTVTEPVTLVGGNADGEVAGIIYVPAAHVQINGSSSEFIVDQVIADTFKINGNGGTIKVLKRVGVDAVIIAAGLVD